MQGNDPTDRKDCKDCKDSRQSIQNGAQNQFHFLYWRFRQSGIQLCGLPILRSSPSRKNIFEQLLSNKARLQNISESLSMSFPHHLVRLPSQYISPLSVYFPHHYVCSRNKVFDHFARGGQWSALTGCFVSLSFFPLSFSFLTNLSPLHSQTLAFIWPLFFLEVPSVFHPFYSQTQIHIHDLCVPQLCSLLLPPVTEPL